MDTKLGALVWPMDMIPIFVLVGAPLVVGAAVFMGLERVLKLPR